MSKLLAALAVFLVLSGCTNKEQEEATARQEQRERREAEELQWLKDKQTRAQESAPTVVQEPEQPEAPAEPEKVAQYKLLEYGRGLTPRVNCLCREKSECGMTFYACENGLVYACVHEVSYSVGETTQTENNANACE